MYWLVSYWRDGAKPTEVAHDLMADEEEAKAHVEELTKNFHVEIQEIEPQ